MGEKKGLLLKLQNQQQPPPSIYSKVGCFWPNLEFDFFAYIFPAIYGVCGNTVGSFIRWPLRTALTDCFKGVLCFCLQICSGMYVTFSMKITSLETLKTAFFNQWKHFEFEFCLRFSIYTYKQTFSAETDFFHLKPCAFHVMILLHD